MPLDPPVTSAARSAIGAALYLKVRLRTLDGRRTVPYASLPVVAGRVLIAALLSACSLIAAGCGSSGDDDADKPPAVARPEDFPTADGKTLGELRKRLPEGGPVLAPAVSQLTVGGNRFGFGLFDRGRNQIADAQVAIYMAPVGGGEARGPFVADWESLKVDAPFQSQSVKSDPDAARSVYVADLKFAQPGQVRAPRPGETRRPHRGRDLGGPAAGRAAKARDDVPEVGEQAPRIHTPTEADVGGDLATIDTRAPHDSMHDVDFADVVGKRAGRAGVRHPAPMPEPRLRTGGGHRRAGQVPARRQGRLHPPWRSSRTTRSTRATGPRWPPTACPASPGSSRSTRGGRVAARIEGAFSADELTAAVKRALEN